MSHKKWSPHMKDLADLNPSKVRDLITQCFFFAHKERFAEASRFFGQDPSEEDLYRTMVGIVRVAFRETDNDYENPTRDSLATVVQYLARKAAIWRAPSEIIEHNRQQLHRLLLALG